MRFQGDNTNTTNLTVYLNGAPLPFAVSADDNEGWVEVLDTKAIADITAAAMHGDPGDEHPEPLTALPTKKLFGKVEIKPVLTDS